MRTFALVILLVAYVASAPDPVKGVRTGSTAAPTARPTAPTARPTAPTARPTAPTGRPTAPTGRSTSRGPTTTPRTYGYCRFCGRDSSCPFPFRASSSAVSTVIAFDRWCEKISPDNGGQGPFTRGAAQPGDCSYSGCYKTTRGGQRLEICCCRGDYCNMGVVTSKSVSVVILSTLASLFFFLKF